MIKQFIFGVDQFGKTVGRAFCWCILIPFSSLSIRT
jgi:hypothetical protein